MIRRIDDVDIELVGIRCSVCSLCHCFHLRLRRNRWMLRIEPCWRRSVFVMVLFIVPSISLLFFFKCSQPFNIRS